MTREDTTIIGGSGDKAEIDRRIRQIRAQIEKATSDYDREKLEERLAKLAGGRRDSRRRAVGGGDEE